MNVDDATCEVIDTSDTEERELLHAQVPGYYQKVWGTPSHTGVEIDDEKELPHKSPLVLREPWTPSPSTLVNISLRSPSPPLEFPQSPSPDPLCLPPVISPDRSLLNFNRSIPHPDSEYESNAGLTGKTSDSTEVDILSPPSIVHDTRREIDDFQAPPSFSPRSPSGSSPESPIYTESGHRKRTNNPRFRSLTLTPPPPSQPSVHPISPTPSSSLSPAPPSPGAGPSFAPPSPPIIIPPDPNPPPRPYSLRNRSAMQLNPFQYEKRLYKQQLRGMPEAIVKNPTTAVGRRERYHQRDEYSGNSSDGEGGDDGDDGWRKGEQRREKKRQREIGYERIRELGIAIPSEDEDEMLQELGAEENVAGGDAEKRGKKRKRRLKARDFPMVVGTAVPSPYTPQREDSVELPPVFRPRPTSREPDMVPGSSKSVRTLPTPISPGPMDLDRDFSLGLHDEAIDFESSIQAMGAGGKSAPIIVDELDSDIEPTRRRIRRHREHENENSDVQVIEGADTGDDPYGDGANSSEESSEVEMTGKDWKRFKVMGRMMPAALVRKLLHGEQDKLKQKEKSRTRQSKDSDNEDDAPLQPGRGRKRIVSPGSMDPKRYEIIGDPESESDDEGEEGPLLGEEVIDLVNSDEDQSDDTGQSLEESEEGLDAGDIQTWLAPDLGYEPEQQISTLPSAFRMPRSDNERDRPRGGDLIDRMLQRTNRVGPRDPKPARKHQAKVRGPRDPNARPALHVVTREGRRLGAGGGRQTKLAFPKVSKPRTSGSAGPRGPSVDQHQERRAEPRENIRKKTKTHARRAVQAQLFVVGGKGRKITSGRRRQTIHIDDNDDDFHEALAPTGHNAPRRARPWVNNDRERQKNKKDILDRFRDANDGEEPDAFDAHPNGSQRHSHVTLDFDIPLLPSGMTFGTDSYTGKGRLALLVSVLNDEIEAPRPLAVTTFEQDIYPDLPVSQFSSLLTAACDHLYDASIAAVDDPEMPLKMKASEVTMHTLSQLVSFRAWDVNDEDGQMAAAISGQTAHLTGRIDKRLELVSADGHILDTRSFALYWFAVELELRAVFARRKRKKAEADQIGTSTTVAEYYAVLLLRRLLEYGLDRTVQPLQQLEPLDITSPDIRTIELWACLFHLSPFFGQPENGVSTSTSSFWRMVETAMEKQSNKPDSSLDTSERLWRTMFSLCAISQFSVHGLTMSAIRLEQNWPMVSKALGCIRLGANEQLDHSKPASTLKKRDKYLRLVTARCLLLDVRYRWRLHDADPVFRGLCAIFRSRKFSNLLGETSDFPVFIRDRDEPLFHAHTDDDTAYGLFLKMIVRALKDSPDVDGTARTRKLSKLLGIAVPVGSMSFTKAAPPIGQELSMLYNRYSAIIVAIYVESTPANIHSRLQQVRRYITFKDADCDSQAASIRAMMNLAILLRHLNQPLDDVLAWASEMMDDLLENYRTAEQDPHVAQSERDQLVISIQLLLGSVRMVIENPTLNRSGARPAKYPDPALLREDWTTRILSSASLSSDHRTGVEIRKCIQSFLTARSKIIPPPPIPRPSMDQLESQDEYGDAGLDMDDPAVLALLDSLETLPDENYIADKKASEIMSELATKRIYSLVCRHLGRDFDRRFPGSYFLEGDQWIECWLGCASVAVRHKARDWAFYIKMARAACEGIKNNESCRRRVYMRFLLTMLQLDPTSYDSNEDKFLELWFETIVSPEITIEHEFNARLFSVGALGNVLFRNLPCAADLSTGLVSFDRPEFEELRQTFVEVVIGNVAEHLGGAMELYTSFIEKMLKTLRECLQSMESGPARANYTKFCARVQESVRKHGTLAEASALRSALSQNNL